MTEINVTLHVVGVSSTSAVFTPAATLNAPVLAGTLVGSVTVQPQNWVGMLTLSGPDSALFSANVKGEIRTASDINQGGDFNFSIGILP